MSATSGSNEIRKLLSIDDLSVAEVIEITNPAIDYAPDKSVVNGLAALLFSQPSVRTLGSFAAAALQVGLIPIRIDTDGRGGNDINWSDEFEHLGLIGAKIVIFRHGKPLSVSDFASISVPVINGGDGSNEHPTQALVDLAVMRHFGADKKTLVINGNCKAHRTIHSLVKILKHFPSIRTIVTAPKEDLLPKELGSDHCEQVPVTTRHERNAVFAEADFLYLTPSNFFANGATGASDLFGISHEEAVGILKPSAKILHPFPRHGEVDMRVDRTSYNAYSLQAKFATPIRKRVLDLLVNNKVSG